MCSRSAARRKCSVSATATTYRRCLNSMASQTQHVYAIARLPGAVLSRQRTGRISGASSSRSRDLAADEPAGPRETVGVVLNLGVRLVPRDAEIGERRLPEPG